MRRRSFIKEIVLLSSFPAIAKAAPGIGRSLAYRAASVPKMASGGGGGACTTQQYSVTGAFNNFDDWSFYTYKAMAFTVGGTGFTCCAVDADLLRQGSPGGTLTAKIYTNNSGSPGTLIGTGSDAVNRNSISTSETFQSFVNLSASLSASTTYWLILQASTVDPSGAVHVLWIADNSSGTLHHKGSTDGTNWDDLGTIPHYLKLYST